MYVPSWFPGAGFQKKAVYMGFCRKLADEDDSQQLMEIKFAQGMTAFSYIGESVVV